MSDPYPEGDQEGIGRTYGRRVGDEWRRAVRRVLIGLHDSASAGDLARWFDEAGFLPTLVFSCDHLVREARHDIYGVIVLDDRFVCQHDSRCAEKVRAASPVPLMVVGHVDDDEETNIDLVLDPSCRAGDIVAQATRLVDMSRPVRLPGSVRWGPLELDVGRHQAVWDGRELKLSRLQFRIMEVLAMAAGSVVSVEQLASLVWGQSSIGDRDRLVAHVRRIRKLIEEDPSRPRFLLRVRGRGFRLSDSPEG